MGKYLDYTDTVLEKHQKGKDLWYCSKQDNLHFVVKDKDTIRDVNPNPHHTPEHILDNIIIIPVYDEDHPTLCPGCLKFPIYLEYGKNFKPEREWCCSNCGQQVYIANFMKVNKRNKGKKRKKRVKYGVARKESNLIIY